MTGTDKKWFTYTNGVHTDSLDPETFNKCVDFLEIYVAKRNPAAAGAIAHGVAPVLYSEVFGVDGRQPAAGPGPDAAQLTRRRRRRSSRSPRSASSSRTAPARRPASPTPATRDSSISSRRRPTCSDPGTWARAAS